MARRLRGASLRRRRYGPRLTPRPHPWPRRDLLLGLAAAGAPFAARAQEPVAAAPAAEPAATVEELVTLDLQEDDARRLRVPVTIDGRGPFPFLVDTGADHSVLSAELAGAMKLPAAGFARVNGIAGAAVAPRAQVRRLEVGGRRLERVAAPLLPRRHLGALGLIGLDALAGQRVEIDFARRRMEVRPSRGFRSEPGEVVVRGKARFGKLILVDSTVRREPVFVVLDTGAEDSIGNPALRALIRRRRDAGLAPRTVELRSVTGETVSGEVDELAELTLGGVLMRSVPMVFADLHTFRIYRLTAEPALMLGMGTLRSFDRVRVDFGRREVGFQLPRVLAPGST